MTGTMVIREGYLRQLRAGRGLHSVVKIIMGVRRCGKSTLMEQYIHELRLEGIPEDHIIRIDLEDQRNQHIRDKDALNGILTELIPDDPCFVFLDELQNVEGWEMTVAAMCNRGNVDLYVTGSNGYLLSSELSTHITGRYVEIRMLPLSFHEYSALRSGLGDNTELLSLYLKYGGLPMVDPSLGKTFCMSLLEGIVDSVINKDVSSRSKTPNSSTVERIARFLYSNIGNESNMLSISKGSGLSQNTVERYVKGMLNAGIFEYAEKYDIIGKKLLNTNGKYYAADLGMRNASLGGAQGTDMSRPLENIVYLELLRRGYTVRVGSYGNTEVDFTATIDDRTEFYQVCQTLMSEGTREREIRSYRMMRNSHRRFILTLDRLGIGNDDGVEIVNIIDWLLDDGIDPKVVPAPERWMEM